MRAEAELKLAGLDEQVAAINESLRVDVDDIDLPPIEVPHPQITRERSLPLVRSGPRAGWSHGEQCRRLIRRKAYEVRS